MLNFAMPMPTTAKWPKPKNEDEFEDICADFFRLRWKDPNAQRHGRRGQRQHGVDIVGHPPWFKGKTVGGQSKNTDDLTLAVVIAEADKAKSFPGGLAEFYVVTSGDRDAALQSEVREHFRAKPAPFHVEVIFWPDVTADLSGDDALVAKHWKGFVLPPTSTTSNSASAMPTWIDREGANENETSECHCEFAIQSPTYLDVDVTELTAEVEKALRDGKNDYIANMLLRQPPVQAAGALAWSAAYRPFANVLDKWQMEIGASSLMIRRWSTFTTSAFMLFETLELLDNVVRTIFVYDAALERCGMLSAAGGRSPRVQMRLSVHATKQLRLHDTANVLASTARFSSPVSLQDWQVQLDDDLQMGADSVAKRVLNRAVAQFRFDDAVDERFGRQHPVVIRIDDDAFAGYLSKANL